MNPRPIAAEIPPMALSVLLQVTRLMPELLSTDDDADVCGSDLTMNLMTAITGHGNEALHELLKAVAVKAKHDQENLDDGC